MFDPQEYNITIKKVRIDGETLFKATIQELPDVAEYGQTYGEVYELALDTLRTAASLCAESNTPFPQPVAQKEFSYA